MRQSNPQRIIPLAMGIPLALACLFWGIIFILIAGALAFVGWIFIQVFLGL